MILGLLPATPGVSGGERPAAIPLHPAEPRHEQRIALAELARTGEPWCRPALLVEQHLHRRASKSRSISTESSGSIANTPDPRSCSQGRWLGEMPPAGEELERWGREAAARHPRVAKGPAGGPEALARVAQ